MKRLLPFALVFGTLVAPAGAFASGVVLKVQPARHLVAVARTPSNVALIHTAAASRLHVGQRVDVKARSLRNGTLEASTVTVVGHTRKVSFHGVVLGRSHGKLAVSAGGAVITLRMGSRSTASARDSSPATGSQVGVTATVGAGGELDEDSVTVFSPTSPGGRIEGTLTLGTGTIAVIVRAHVARHRSAGGLRPLTVHERTGGSRDLRPAGGRIAAAQGAVG